MRPDPAEVAKLAQSFQDLSLPAALYLQGLQARHEQKRSSDQTEALSHGIKHVYSSVATVGLFMAGALTMGEGNPLVSAAFTSASILGLGKAVYHALTDRRLLDEARVAKSAQQLVTEDVVAQISTRSLWDRAMVNLGARHAEIRDQVAAITERLNFESPDFGSAAEPPRMRMMT